MVTQETLDALNKKREDMLKEAEVIETQRNALDPAKNKKELAELDKTSAQFNKEADALLKEIETANAELKRRADFDSKIKALKDKQTISIQKDTRNGIKESNKFNLDRCVSIAVGKSEATGLEREYLQSGDVQVHGEKLRLSSALCQHLFQYKRASGFSLANLESDFHSLKVSQPVGFCVAHGADLQFGDTIGIAVGIDYFAGAGSGGATTGASSAFVDTEVAHESKAMTPRTFRSNVPMNLSAIRTGGLASDLSQLEAGARDVMGKWTDVAVLGYVSSVFGNNDPINKDVQGTAGSTVAVSKGNIDTIYSRLVDRGSFSTNSVIIASQSIAASIRGKTITAGYPYVVNGRIYDIPFNGYPMAGITNGAALLGVMMDKVQIKATPLTIYPDMSTVTQNVIKVRLIGDIGAALLVPSAAYYIENLKA